MANLSAQASKLCHLGVGEVSRLKKGIRHRVAERRGANRRQGVTSDQTIELTSARGRERCPHPLRRIGCRDPGTGKHHFFLTTNFKLSAKTVADIHKSRWQVELFLKWIKQELKVRHFVGTSRNAVLTQIWIAMRICLLVAYVKFLNRVDWTVGHILRLLQLDLFERRTLADLLKDRKQDPPPDPPQTAIKFAWS